LYCLCILLTQKLWPLSKMAAVAKNRNFFNCPLLVYYKSKWDQVVTAATWSMSSLTYLSGFSVKFVFQSIYTNKAYYERKITSKLFVTPPICIKVKLKFVFQSIYTNKAYYERKITSKLFVTPPICIKVKLKTRWAISSSWEPLVFHCKMV
jgi:hypothetical protein